MERFSGIGSETKELHVERDERVIGTVKRRDVDEFTIATLVDTKQESLFHARVTIYPSVDKALRAIHRAYEELQEFENDA